VVSPVVTCPRGRNTDPAAWAPVKDDLDKLKIHRADHLLGKGVSATAGNVEEVRSTVLQLLTSFPGPEENAGNPGLRGTRGSRRIFLHIDHLHCHKPNRDTLYETQS
jgi:hypothetical protein